MAFPISTTVVDNDIDQPLLQGTESALDAHTPNPQALADTDTI